jgi:hypothetical protein
MARRLHAASVYELEGKHRDAIAVKSTGFGEKNLLESIGHGKSAHPLQFRFTPQGSRSALRL